MLDFGADVAAVLGATQTGRTYGVARYQGASVPVQVEQSASVAFDGGTFPQSTCSVHVFGYGESLVPRSRDAFLAPYGQEVSLFREVLARDDSVLATVPLGVFRVTGNSGWRETVRSGRVLDWDLDVDLADRFRMFNRAKLLDRKSPEPGATMYAELRRLSLIPVQESLPDVSVPAGLAYTDRMSAVKDLADLTNGVPTLTRQGVLTLRQKDAWAESVLEPVFDISGTIEWQDGQSDEFFNFVQASSQNSDYVAFAAETDDSNPLSVRRAGESTFEHSSAVYVDQGSTQAGADTILRRLLGRRSREVTVTCTNEALLLELGDVGWMRDPNQGRAVLGEVAGLQFSFDPTVPPTVRLIVAEEA